VKERAMSDDEQLREEIEQAVLACLAAPMGRMSERGCEPPYAMRLVDEEGTAATGLIDEYGEGELEFSWIPKFPFTMEIADHENMKGERVEICKAS
jgi:hypothetical protein